MLREQRIDDLEALTDRMVKTNRQRQRGAATQGKKRPTRNIAGGTMTG